MFSCNASMGKYYAYGITFTRSVSVQIQVSFGKEFSDLKDFLDVLCSSFGLL